MRVDRHKINWMAILGAVLTLVGAFLPWMVLSADSFGAQAPYYRAVPGVEEWPGKLVAALSLLIVGIAIRKGKAAPLLPMLLGILIAGLAWYWLDTVRSWQHLYEITQDSQDPTPATSVGIGYFVIMAGVGLLFLSGALLGVRAALARRDGERSGTA